MLYGSTFVRRLRLASPSVRISISLNVTQGEQTGRTTTNCRRIPITSFRCGPAAQGSTRDRRRNGYAYIKKQCMHCVDPNCVSVAARNFSATERSENRHCPLRQRRYCTGCRYCMVACPYNVPKYDYNNPFGALHKCELCNQKVWNVSIKAVCPGCVEVLPGGRGGFSVRVKS